MTSHGIARTAKVRTEEQRQQDIEKIDKYRSLENQLRQKVADERYDTDTFHLTSRLLRSNPEYYTVWNVRRRCLIYGLLSERSHGSSRSTELPSSSASATPTPSSAASLPSSSHATPQARASPTAGTSGTTHETGSHPEAEAKSAMAQDMEMIRSELVFTVPLLQEFPKCYWIWNYRLWILNQATDRLGVAAARRVWEEELGLLSKLLHKDRRNFHAWTYRRFVVDHLESAALAGHSMAEAELDYTRKKIHEDLSNFSAWHNRSQLIPVVLTERNADQKARKEFFENELETIKNALNVGPEDQSLWYYHQYLISNLTNEDEKKSMVPNLPIAERERYIQQEIADIQELLEDYADIKLIYIALIDYTLAIRQLQQRDFAPIEADEVAQWLVKLKQLDPKRMGRWRDLESRVGLYS